MNCSEFWSEADRRTLLSSDLQNHLAVCPACTARWEHQLALAQGLRALADDWSSVEAPLRVEAGLRAAYRVQLGSRRPAYHSRWAPVLAWASAAAATIALAMVLLHPAHPSAGSP